MANVIDSTLRARGFVPDGRGGYFKPGKQLPTEAVKIAKETIQQEEHRGEPVLNKTERAWLQELSMRPGVWAVYSQSITLLIAYRCRYTPDFVCIEEGKKRLQVYEVKGFMRDDANVKLKTAARMFALLADFWLVRKQPKGGGWNVQKVKT